MEIADAIVVQNRGLARLDSEVLPDFRVEVDGVSESSWSELLDQFDDANVYQTWAFGVLRWEEKNLSHLILKRGSDVVAMAQLRILQPAKLRFGIAYLRWGPICHRSGRELDPSVVCAMAKALRDEYVTRRGLYLEVLPNAFCGSPRAEAFQLAFSGFSNGASISKEQYRTFVLDLSPSLEVLRKNLDKKWRNQLNAASRNNLEVIEASDNEHYEEFRALYCQMRQRKQFDSDVDVDTFYRIHQRLRESHRFSILICRHQKKPVAALVCSALGESAIYLLGATNEEGMKVKGSYLLQWAAIESMKKKGIRFYDLGGIDPVGNPGVHHFKSGLSGTDVSHLAPLIACDNGFSFGMVKLGQFVRQGVRDVRQRAVRSRIAAVSE